MYEVRVEYYDQKRWYPAPHATQMFAIRRAAESYAKKIGDGHVIALNLPLRVSIFAQHIVQLKYHNHEGKIDVPTTNTDGS